MADYIKKFRTSEGDKQVDYNALGNLPLTIKDVYDFVITSQDELDEAMSDDRMAGKSVLLYGFTYGNYNSDTYLYENYIDFKGAKSVICRNFSLDGNGDYMGWSASFENAGYLDFQGHAPYVGNSYVPIYFKNIGTVANTGKVDATEYPLFGGYQFNNCKSIVNCTISGATNCSNIVNCYVYREPGGWTSFNDCDGIVNLHNADYTGYDGIEFNDCTEVAPQKLYRHDLRMQLQYETDIVYCAYYYSAGQTPFYGIDGLKLLAKPEPKNGGYIDNREIDMVRFYRSDTMGAGHDWTMISSVGDDGISSTESSDTVTEV